MNRPPRLWTPKEDDQLRAGKRPRGRSDAAIRRRKDRLGLVKRRAPVDEAAVALLVAEGLSSDAIVERLGLGYHTVLGVRARLGIKAPTGRPKAQRDPSNPRTQRLPDGQLAVVVDGPGATTVTIGHAVAPSPARTPTVWFDISVTTNDCDARLSEILLDKLHPESE